MMVIPEQCLRCKHYKPNEYGFACPAFPEGIPKEIIDLDFDHRNPWPGDGGIRWEPKDRDTQNPFDENTK